MKIPFLILLLGLSSNVQAQFRDLYQALQSDSIYKNAFVKSRLIKYYSKTMQRNNSLETFNEKGQIIKTIIYNLQDGETPLYQTEFMYDSTGKLISSISKDLSGNNGYLVNPYSKTSNEVASKYEYNLAGKLIRKINIGLNGFIFRETIYDENSHSEITRDFNDKKQLCAESFSTIDKNGLLIKTESKYNLWDSSKIMTVKNSQAFELNDLGQTIKSFDPTGQNKTVFQYYYNSKGLLKRVLISGYNEIEARVSYRFR
jgi:hypothetical protein